MSRTPSIVALLLALVACGALGALVLVDVHRSAPASSPRAAIRAATAARLDARDRRSAAHDRSFRTAFDPAMVRDRVVWRETPTGRPTTDLAIVNATPGANLADTATKCAESVGSRTRVQCYVFASTAAYEYKDITGHLHLDTPTAIVNLCWATMASDERAGAKLHVSDMRQAAQVWEAQQCPDGWQGTEATS
jgi:hypothetical protein